LQKSPNRPQQVNLKRRRRSRFSRNLHHWHQLLSSLNLLFRYERASQGLNRINQLPPPRLRRLQENKQRQRLLSDRNHIRLHSRTNLSYNIKRGLPANRLPLSQSLQASLSPVFLTDLPKALAIQLLGLAPASSERSNLVSPSLEAAEGEEHKQVSNTIPSDRSLLNSNSKINNINSSHSWVVALPFLVVAVAEEVRGVV
jgi:hypothetical protein